MKRRAFLSTTAAGAAALATSCSASQQPAEQHPSLGKPVMMKLGTQRGPTDARILSYVARHGVEGICGRPKATEDRQWQLEDLLAMRELCDKHNVSLDLLDFPLTSGGIERQIFPNILLGNDPERDRDIDLVCEMIRTTAQAGIPCLKYNMALHPVLRTERTPGRGDAQYSTWDYDLAPDKDVPHTLAGHVSREENWERITYFLERVIPVAEEYKIRMACHPHDPGLPPQGYQGIYRVLGDVEGLKRFVDIQKSLYHGLNLCLGTTAEMLRNPNEELHDVIRYFGNRKKIFNIHFRNIIGRRNKFQEVYPDNGDIDMMEVMRTLKEVEYPYLVMPDHVPRHPDDEGGLQAFAFSYGYIRALLQMVEAEG
jgi:mannonate dehydratase